MNRQLLIKMHALLAAFMLPAALMFLVTGALYTWGLKGSYEQVVFEIDLAEPLNAEIGALRSLAEMELAKRAVRLPEGKPKLKKYGTHYLLEWTGSSRDVLLEPTSDPMRAALTVKETTWYRRLVQLHKAKGGTVFKVYAAGFALALMLILLSGYFMAWQMPRLRGATLLVTILGGLTFVVVVWLS